MTEKIRRPLDFDRSFWLPTSALTTVVCLVLNSGCSSDKSAAVNESDNFPQSPKITNTVGAEELPDKASTQMAFASELVKDIESMLANPSSTSQNLAEDNPSSTSQNLAEDNPVEQLPAPHEVLNNLSFGGSNGVASFNDIEELADSLQDSGCSKSKDILEGALAFRKVLVGQNALTNLSEARTSLVYDLKAENTKDQSESINYTLAVKPDVSERTGTSFTATISAGSDGDVFFSRLASDFSINISKYFKHMISTVIERAVKSAVNTIVTVGGGKIVQSDSQAQSAGLTEDGDSDSSDLIIAGKFKSLLNVESAAQRLTYDAAQDATWSKSTTSTEGTPATILLQSLGKINLNGADGTISSAYEMSLSKTGSPGVFRAIETSEVKKIADNQLQFSIDWRVTSDPSIEPIKISGTVTRNDETGCQLTVTSEGDFAQIKRKSQESMRQTLGINED